MSRFILIDTNSILLKPAKETERESLIRIDFARYQLEVLEDLYIRLFDVLDQSINSNTVLKNKSFVLVNYAWQIIETANTFKRIMNKMFPSYTEFDADMWDQIRLIRNTNQHIEERMSLFVEEKEPHFGYLTARYINQETEKEEIYISVIGLMINNVDFNTSVPLEETNLHFKNITSTTLNSIGANGEKYIIELLLLFEDLRKIKNYLESIVHDSIFQNGLEPFDWSNRKDFSVRIKTN